jgi:exodeoxyribonuclease V beta subunit
MMKSKPLIAHQIPLQGKHLIEASAGTGKTFNITRLYLRLLLEQELTVQQILVMTFTKDATEELRGRIDNFIRYALNHWHQLSQTDEFFIAINDKVPVNKVQLLLKQALLFLDEAAIYTIHGFCKSVLTQHAFSTGISFDANMENQCIDIQRNAVEDWYRQLASDKSEQFLTVAEFWPCPQALISHFNRAINQSSPLQLVSESELIEHFTALVRHSISTLTAHREQLITHLISIKPLAEQSQRETELDSLMQWLAEVAVDHQSLAQPMPDAFIDGRRYGRSKQKQLIKEIFTPVNEVKKQAKYLLKKIAKAKALVVVRQGIYQIRAAIEQQKLTANILTFDDLISRLYQQLTMPQGKHLAQLLFDQFPVALVDEFQDTDPQQFSIIRSIYYHQRHAGLFMIGDPKQAIYGFRGGDVFAYLSARQDCDHCWLMDTNWRSSDTMIAGYNRLFCGDNEHQSSTQTFGYGIEYYPVKAAEQAINKHLVDEKYCSLQFVHFAVKDQKSTVSQDFRKEMATWCANEIVRLFNAPQNNSIVAKDIALLVRDGREALDVKTALTLAGLPSVFLSNKSNLLQSQQTTQLLQLLKGILYSESERFFSAAVACQLLPYPAEKFYQLKNNQHAWQALKWDFQQLRTVWQNHGFITMALQLMHDHMCILGNNADRILTNLLHLFELLQSASQRRRQPQELFTWFEQQSYADAADVETELRLESEENLIRIVTQHGSKGLEYPIVFIPFATRHKNPLKAGSRHLSVIEYHGSDGTLLTSLDGSDEAKTNMADEAYAESIRLLYVAVTRAEKRCYLLTTAFEHYHLSPLGQTIKMATKSAILPQLQKLADNEPLAIGVELIENPTIAMQYNGTISLEEKSQTAKFTGSIERDWWLSSFTALSRNIRDNGLSLPDRDTDSGILPSPQLSNESSPSLRFELPKGAHSGNLLHDILEHLNFNQPEWQQTLRRLLLKYGALPKGFSSEDLIDWLTSILHCPLHFSLAEHSALLPVSVFASAQGEAQAFSLSSLSPLQTMREAEFYFPLNDAKTEALANLLTDHRNSKRHNAQTDLTMAYPASQVELAVSARLNGMMHGFIDLLFEYQGRYYVCDYKSNYLGDDHHCYQTLDMQKNIEAHYYDLQYLIYALALHRYLAITISDYSIEQHFGGVYYLYLRGMSAEPKHQGCGVYFSPIDAAELEQLNQLFAGDASFAQQKKNTPLGEKS